MPVSGATRELSVTYNSTTVSKIHGFTFVEMSKDRAAVSFDAIVTGSSEAAFASACSAIEGAFSTPYKDLTVALGSQNLIAVTQSGNTGLDAVPTITKVGGSPDSGRSRRYRIRIEYGRPATWAATSGLRDSNVILSLSPSGRATVTLRGTFTAVTSNDAKAQYDAQIGAWADAQKTWLGISTWQLVGVPAVRVSINRKTADFERTYLELFATQGAASVVRQELIVTRGRRGSEYSPQTQSDAWSQYGNQGSGGITVVPMTEVTATYSAWIDKAQTTDLKATWATLEAFVIAQIATELGTSSFAMMSASPSYNLDENRITATITGLARDTDTTNVIQNRFEQSVRTVPGYEFLPVWDGNAESAIVQQTQQVRTRTTTRRWRTLSGQQAGDSGAGWIAGGSDSVNSEPLVTPLSDAGNGATWYKIDDDFGTQSLAVGRQPFLIYMTEHHATIIERAAVPVT